MNIETTNDAPRVEAPRESVGHVVKQAREHKNLSVDEAARATRIKKEFLIAIEQDKFDLLPGDVFARGFVRSYADYLGLDGKTIASRAGSVAIGAIPTPAGVGGRTAGTAGRVMLVAFLGVVAAGVWYVRTHGIPGH